MDLKVQELTENDKRICEEIGEVLRERGLFVGLDVIGNHLTEINVTSPTCLREEKEQDSISRRKSKSRTKSDHSDELRQETTKSRIISNQSRQILIFSLALITHLFFILNTAHTTKLRSNHRSMEIIFSETKTDQLSWMKALKIRLVEQKKPIRDKTCTGIKRKKTLIKAREKNRCRAEKPNAEQLIARSIAQAKKHYDLIDNPYQS